MVRVSGYDSSTGRRRVRQLGTHDTKNAALAQQRAVAEGRVGSDDETLGEYLSGVWLPGKDARVEISTYDQYRWAVEGHIIALLGVVRMKDLTPEVIDGWVRALVVAPEAGKARLGASSVRNACKVLSMAMEGAVFRGRLPRNPVSPKRPRTYRKMGWTLTEAQAEAQAFLAGIEDHRLHPAFHLTLVTGLRRGEPLGLHWDHVDLQSGQPAVVQQLAVEGGGPLPEQLKTEASQRVVPIGRTTVGVLEQHRVAHGAEQAMPGEGREHAGLVFPTTLGGPTDPNNSGRLMRDLISRTGVPSITPTGLRHTAQSIGRVVAGDYEETQADSA